MRHRLLAGACLPALMATALAVGSAQAQAQSPPSAAGTQSQAQASSDEATVGEVIVTANKRAENVQDVPAAVQVLGGAELRGKSITEFTDLNKVAPSLVVRPAEQPQNSNISVRGIGTTAFSIGVEPSVAVQIDDVPIAILARAFTDLSDIERIELLQGPQSTLYGKSASAGLINIITPAPTRTLTGRVSGFATDDDEQQISGFLSGPITDTLRFRVAASYDEFSGNVKNLYTGKDPNGRIFGSLSGKLQWQPNDKFQATGAVSYQPGQTTIGRPFTVFDPRATLRGNAAIPFSVLQPGVTAGPDNLNVSNDYPSGNRFADWAESLRMSYDLGFATLISITAHEAYNLKDRLDVDEGSSRLIDNRQDAGKFNADQWTQELRLVSPEGKRLRYTAGFFYADNEYSRAFQRGPVFSLAHWFATAGAEQKSVFGQIDFDVLPDTTVTGGARYQDETVDYTFRDILNGNAFFKGNSPDDFFTYKFAVNHKFTHEISAYASYTTGHKGETYDLTTGFNTNRALAGPVLPETSESREIGLRSQWFERRLTVNLTYFNADYDNYQAQGIENLPDGTQNFRLTNVGKIGLQGVEFESAARIENLTAGVNVAWLDATIDSFPVAQCYPLQTAAQGCTGSPARQNLKGFRPPQAPEWKVALSAEYHHALGSLPFEGVVSGNYAYQSRVNYALNQDPFTVQPGFGVLNLSAGVRSRDRKWEVIAFLNNVTDEHYYVNIFNSSGTYNNFPAIQAIEPRDFNRYFGVRGSYSF